jgi:hypothetical protein
MQRMQGPAAGCSDARRAPCCSSAGRRTYLDSALRCSPARALARLPRAARPAAMVPPHRSALATSPAAACIPAACCRDAGARLYLSPLPHRSRRAAQAWPRAPPPKHAAERRGFCAAAWRRSSAPHNYVAAGPRHAAARMHRQTGAPVLRSASGARPDTYPPIPLPPRRAPMPPPAGSCAGAALQRLQRGRAATRALLWDGAGARSAAQRRPHSSPMSGRPPGAVAAPGASGPSTAAAADVLVMMDCSRRSMRACARGAPVKQGRALHHDAAPAVKRHGMVCQRGRTVA